MPLPLMWMTQDSHMPPAPRSDVSSKTPEILYEESPCSR